MKSIRNIDITRVTNETSEHTVDQLAIEEPLEIRLIYGTEQTEKKTSVTMRTPGNDEELAVGFLFTEGMISDFSQIAKVYTSAIDSNIIYVALQPTVELNLKSLDRNFYTTSSCGVCGKSSIDAVKTQCKIEKTHTKIEPINSSLLYTLPNKIREQQKVFESTGGLHASALFGLNGEFKILREDVGRHNALDKLIGYSLQYGIEELQNAILLLSGRASFELIQKAMMAGIRVIAAIGAPSSLAVELAKESDITLVGFLKENKMNIYSCPERILV
ncbi:MAG: formate dehydrogenase accessory sulfurtransferase FdhD [Bacteroidetes bacterium]|nr:formate dehydrogenase accessory sulfurtransferase FdhD [Bacteroidota bacterium]